MKKINWLELLIGVSLLSLILISFYLNIDRIGLFASQDPYYHWLVIQETISKQEVISTIDFSYSQSRISYFTLLYPLSAVLSLVTGIAPLEIVKWSGIFFALVLFLLIIIICRKSPNRRLAFFSAALFFTSAYSLKRFVTFLPENLAVVFLATIFFFLLIERYWLALFLCLVYLFSHFRSIYMPMLLIAIYFAINREKIEFSKKAVYYILILIVLSLPMWAGFYESLKYYVTEQVISKDSIIAITPEISQYAPIGLFDLGQLLGPLLLILGAMAIVAALRTKNKNYRAGAVFVLIIAILVNGVRFGIFIQPDRFIIYGLIPLIFLSSILLKTKLLDSSKMRIFLVFFTVMLLVSALYFSSYGWSGFTQKDYDAIEFIKAQKNVDVIIPYGAPYGSFYINNTEFENDKIGLIFRATSKEELMENLNKFYGEDKKILLALSYRGYVILRSENSPLLADLKNYEVFKERYNNNEVIVYEIQT